MNYRSKISTKQFILQIFSIVIIIGLVSIVLVSYANNLDRSLQLQTLSGLEEASLQNASLVEKEIHNQFSDIKSISSRITYDGNFNVSEAINLLKDISHNYSFVRIGIADLQGNVVSTDDVENLNLSDREHFQRASEGETVVSSRLSDYVDGRHIIVFSTPIIIEEEIVSVLFGTYDVHVLGEILLSELYNGKGYSLLIEESGDVIIDSQSLARDIVFENVFDYLNESSPHNDEALKTFQDEIRNGVSGVLNLYLDEEKYMRYTKLDMSQGWYLLIIVPADSLNKIKDETMITAYLLTAFVSCLFIIIIIYNIQIRRKKNKELELLLCEDKVIDHDTYYLFLHKAREILDRTKERYVFVSMDLNNFKLINSIYGFEGGDLMLKYIARIWKRVLSDDEIFARKIADRFVALMKYDNFEEKINEFINIAQNEKIEEKQNYVIQPRFGIYIIDNKDEDIKEMSNYAVIAHAELKKNNYSNVLIYDQKLKTRALENKSKSDQLLFALRNNEFCVYYQPKYDVATKEIVGAEALVRWVKPDGNVITPNEFIPLSEKTGLIIPLDEYVFKIVCNDQRSWIDEGVEIIPISINVSQNHLGEQSFVDKYVNIRDNVNIPNSSVELEITESAIFENYSELNGKINKLRACGFKILMDDFGSGYSSLQILKDVSIDILKLDSSFINSFDDEKGKNVIITIIKLAKALNMHVVAEGVETEEQYLFLKKLQCDTIQGFYLSKPLPKDEFAKLLKRK